MPMWNPWRGCRRCSEGCAHCYIHKGDAKRGVDTSEIVQTKDFYKPVEQLKKGGYKMKPGLVYLGFSTDFLCSFCLYPKEQSAKAVGALRIVHPCPAFPLLCAAGDPGVGKSVERRRRQLFACGNGLPHCVHALRRLSGRGDLPGLSVQDHARDNIKSAVIISSVTFGIGHIINLFNGSGMNLVNNLCQIVFAVAVGFLLVTAFYRGGSLIPCILVHSAINMLGTFANDAGLAVQMQLLHIAALILITAAYTLILMRTLPE